MRIGLFAVIGPSRKERLGPPRFLATRREKTCSRSQNCDVVRATATKSSGPGAVNMLASLVSNDPTRALAMPSETPLRCGETKRPPGILTAVRYAKVGVQTVSSDSAPCLCLTDEFET